jgi:hypothetical protein
MTPLAAEWVAKAEGDFATARRELRGTHNLDALAKPVLSEHDSLRALAPALRTLGAYAVETRYPGKSADRALAKDALVLCMQVRRFCRQALKAKK